MPTARPCSRPSGGASRSSSGSRSISCPAARTSSPSSARALSLGLPARLGARGARRRRRPAAGDLGTAAGRGGLARLRRPLCRARGERARRRDGAPGPCEDLRPAPPGHVLSELHEQAAAAFAAAGVAVEVSTAGLRKPVRELYPDRRFLAACRSRGVDHDRLRRPRAAPRRRGFRSGARARPARRIRHGVGLRRAGAVRSRSP